MFTVLYILKDNKDVFVLLLELYASVLILVSLVFSNIW